MAVPPDQQQRQDNDDDGDFTFPTPPPPQQQQFRKDRHHLPCSSPPPVWLLSSPIRRSFSAADCAASPWRDRALLGRCRGGCSPALSDYAAAAGFCDGEEEEEEERMDSLWEDLNDEDAAAGDDDLFLGSLDVSRRRSVGAADAADRARRAAKERDAAVLGASRSSRRRAPGLVVMMRVLKKMFVAHKGKSRVHRDEQQSTTSASVASASPSPSPCNKW